MYCPRISLINPNSCLHNTWKSKLDSLDELKRASEIIQRQLWVQGLGQGCVCMCVCVCQRFSHSSCLATICPQYWHQWACRRPLTNKLKQAAVGWKKALWGHQLMSSPLSLLTQCKSGQRQLEMPADAQTKYLWDLVTVLGRKKNQLRLLQGLKKKKGKKKKERQNRE